MTDWSIEQNAGRGTVTYRAAPRFTAVWETGEMDLTVIEGLFWQDDGSGSGEDNITLHGVQWIDAPPDQATFERLMQRAATEIDAWIAATF